MISLIFTALIISTVFADDTETEVAWTLGEKTTGTITCTDANINNQGCFECLNNLGKACKAKKLGKKDMVLGYCVGHDDEYWNYKCVEATEPCECSRRSRILSKCTNTGGVFLDKGGRAVVCEVSESAACANVDIKTSWRLRLSSDPCTQDVEKAVGQAAAEANGRGRRWSEAGVFAAHESPSHFVQNALQYGFAALGFGVVLYGAGRHLVEKTRSQYSALGFERTHANALF